MKKLDALAWKTRDGQVIPITDMTDNHLLNTVRWLRRNVNALRQMVAQGEVQNDASAPEESGAEIEETYLFVDSIPDDDLLTASIPAWPHLLAELRKRGLNEPRDDDPDINF